MVVISVRCWDLWRAWRSLLGEVVVFGLLLLWWWLVRLLRGGVAVAALEEDFAAGGRPLPDNDERMDVDMVAIF